MTRTQTAIVAAILIAWSSTNLQARDHFAPLSETWNSFQEDESATPLIREANPVAGDRAKSLEETSTATDEEQDSQQDKKKEGEEKNKKCKEL